MQQAAPLPAVRGLRVSTANLGFLLFLLLLAGCGNNPYPPGETARPVLYRALSDDPKTLDPSICFSGDEMGIVALLYPAYFQYHYLKRDPYVLETALGAEEPRRAPHGTGGEAWKFRIRRGLRFADDPCFPGGRGREILAADFLYSFRRMADPDVPCPILPFIEDKIVGLREYIDQSRARIAAGKKTDYDAPIAGLRLDPNDPYTFRILLNQPYPQLRYLMAMPFTSPLAREAAERYGRDLARHPVGSGVYVLAEYKPKRRLVLRANPNRRGDRRLRPEAYPSEGAPGDHEAGLLKDAGMPLPRSEKIVYSILRESITGWNLFQQGYLDGAAVTQNNYQEVVSQGGQLSPELRRRGVQLRREVAANVVYFAFNMRDPVFGGYTPERRKLRQAVSLAIDADTLIDLYRQGNGSKAEFLIPPGIFGHEPGYENPYRKFDLERAKRLLAEAGYPGGIDPRTGERLTLLYDNTATGPAERQFVGLLTRQLEAIGLRVVSRSWRAAVFRERVLHDQFQFIRYSWEADYPDPENFVFLLYGPNRHPGPNHAGYENPEYDRVFEQMRALENGPRRQALIRRLRAIAERDCPWIPAWHNVSLSLHHGWLANVKPHPIANDTAKYVGVDGAGRARLRAAWNRPNYGPAVAAALVFVVGSLPAVALVRERGRSRVRRRPPQGSSG